MTLRIRIAYFKYEHLKADMAANTLRKMFPDCKVKEESRAGNLIAHIYIETPKPKE